MSDLHAVSLLQIQIRDYNDGSVLYHFPRIPNSFNEHQFAQEKKRRDLLVRFLVQFGQRGNPRATPQRIRGIARGLNLEGDASPDDIFNFMARRDPEMIQAFQLFSQMVFPVPQIAPPRRRRRRAAAAVVAPAPVVAPIPALPSNWAAAIDARHWRLDRSALEFDETRWILPLAEIPQESRTDPASFFDFIGLSLPPLLESIQREIHSFRFNFTIAIRLHRSESELPVDVPEGQPRIILFRLSLNADPWLLASTMEIVFPHTLQLVLHQMVQNGIQAIMHRFASEAPPGAGSGWVFDSFFYVQVDAHRFYSANVLQNRMLNENRIGDYLPTPVLLAGKKCTFNVERADQLCGLRAIAMAMWFHERDLQQDRNMPTQARLDALTQSLGRRWDATYPSLGKFESISPSSNRWLKMEKLLNKPIFIYGYEENLMVQVNEAGDRTEIMVPSIFLLRRSSLLPSEDFSYESPLALCVLQSHQTFHYITVTNFRVFLHLTRINTKNEKSKNFSVCPFCLCCIARYRKENNVRVQCFLPHVQKDCYPMNKQIKAVLPEPKKAKIFFRNFMSQMENPILLFADFECIIDPSQQQAHVPCGYAIKVIVRGQEGFVFPMQFYRGENTVEKFWDALFELENSLFYRFITLNKNVSHHYTQEQKASAAKEQCWICKQRSHHGRFVLPFICRVTKKQCGFAHDECIELYYEYDFRFPILFHNLSGYDSHLILSGWQKKHDLMVQIHHDKFKQELERMKNTDSPHLISFAKRRVDRDQIFAIHNTAQKLKCLQVRRLLFLDSYAFLKTSLEKLVSNLGTEHPFSYLKQMEPVRYRQLLRKGIYPYEYMDSFARFEEPQLPPIERFHSQLTGKTVSQEDYDYACQLFRDFNCTCIGDYHDLYLKTDVILLTEVWEMFHKICIEKEGLDPSRFVTLSSFSWASLLKSSSIQLDVFSNEQAEMFFMIEKGIRGGISSVCGKRFSNVASLGKPKTNRFILYLDATNLYGHAMSQSLPTGDFTWVEEEQRKQMEENPFYITQFDFEQEVGMIFEVDLEYPVLLHRAHNDYPLCCERLKMGDSSASSPKLMLSLCDKKNYVIHGKNLAFALQQGLVLKKIHRIIVFKQAKWMQGYVQYHTEERKKTNDAFLKDFHKLNVNGNYGKTMENKRKRVDFHFTSNPVDHQKYIQSSRLKRTLLFHENLCGVELFPKEVLLDKPIIVGFTVLELSKLHMQKFFYNTLKPAFGEDVRLLYTDTDSFVLEINSDEDYVTCMRKIEREMDFSNYPLNHDLYGTTNKGVVGKFKDETAGHRITEFIALRAKMYSYLLEQKEGQDHPEQHYRAKGVKTNGIQHYENDEKDEEEKTCTTEIHHSSFRNVLEKETETMVKYYQLQSKNHLISTIAQEKIALSSKDDKRIYPERIPDADYFSTEPMHECYSYGHYLWEEFTVRHLSIPPVPTEETLKRIHDLIEPEEEEEEEQVGEMVADEAEEEGEEEEEEDEMEEHQQQIFSSPLLVF